MRRGLRPPLLGLLLLLPALLAGCAGAPEGPECRAAGPATTGDRAVQVQVANTMAQATCVEVRFDGFLVASAALPAQSPNLDAHPKAVADFGWDNPIVTVRVTDVATNRTHQQVVQMGMRAYVVAWVDEDSIRVETFEREPAWA